MPKISILFTLFFQINRIESKKIIILISFLLTCVNSVYGQRLVKYLETGIIYTNRTIDVTDMHYYVPIPQNIPGKQEVLNRVFAK